MDELAEALVADWQETAHAGVVVGQNALAEGEGVRISSLQLRYMGITSASSRHTPLPPILRYGGMHVHSQTLCSVYLQAYNTTPVDFCQ